MKAALIAGIIKGPYSAERRLDELCVIVTLAYWFRFAPDAERHGAV
jgi:hypothetical protein